MFTRTELEIKTTVELAQLCLRYGLKPTGNRGYKTSYITSLLVFPAIACNQFQQNRGMRPPTFAFMQELETTIDEMNSPTDEQAALIKISLEGRTLNYPDRYTQDEVTRTP